MYITDKTIARNSSGSLKLFPMDSNKGRHVCYAGKIVNATDMLISMTDVSIITFNTNKDVSSKTGKKIFSL